MRMGIWLLVAFLAIAAIFAGCSQPETTGEGSTPNAPQPATQQAELQVPEEARDVDSFIRPKLESIFGSARLKTYYQSQTPSGSGIALVYELGRSVEPEDASELKSEIAASGYSESFGGMQSEDDFGYVFGKGESVLMVGGTFGENEITVVWGTG